MKFEATPELIAIIGEEWAGTYEVRQLMAPEYLSIGDELIDKMRKQGKEIFSIPPHHANELLVYKCVEHNGKPIKRPIPSKLLELLLPEALKLNTLTLDERRDIFLRPVTAQKTQKKHG